MTAEVVSDIAQVWMGTVLVDSFTDVVVHMYWERWMMVALKPHSQEGHSPHVRCRGQGSLEIDVGGHREGGYKGTLTRHI